MSNKLVGAVGGALVWTVASLASSSVQAAEPYPSPEAAVADLVAAVQAKDAARVIDIFGEDSEDLVLTGVDEIDRRNWAAFAEAQAIASRIVVSDDAATLFVGAEQWPFPVSLRKSADGWSFDADGAHDEILLRRIGANELSVIDTLHTYIRAQYEYYARDRDEDGVLEFAQSVLSTAGERDGLFYPVREGEAASPFGPAIAVAASEGYDYDEKSAVPEPYHGYYFKVLTAQGSSAPGGAFDYVINGNMVAGFGMIAYPADYDVTGVMSFVVGRNGVIYERDLGTATESLVPEITVFDPTSQWSQLVAN
jgi:hypothetical protein